MTKREAAIVGAYTGILLGKFSDMKEYIAEILGRPITTSDMEWKAVSDEIHEESKADFLSIEIS